MPNQTPIINILTYGLPFDLANQVYNEYQDRHREAVFLIDNYDRYSSLADNLLTVELLLALSIFHKRVIANLDAAVKFHGTVKNISKADIIQIGKYSFTGEEKNKLLALTITYRKLLDKYDLTEDVMNYSLTREFLQKLLVIKSITDNAEE